MSNKLSNINNLNIITLLVIHTREELSKQYDITTGEYKGYAGLCDVAYGIFKNKIEDLNAQSELKLETIFFHGEQRHTAKTDPKNWCYQHTWMGVRKYGSKDIIYVDPTAQQFKRLYNDIPDYYVSPTPPPWYMSDRKNFFFFVYGINEWVAVKIIDKFDYYIWGGMCRIYRKIFKIK